MNTQTIASNAAKLPPKVGSFAPLLQTWIRLVVFLAPVLIVTALPVAIADPYNVLWPRWSFVSQGTKQDVGETLNDVLWKLPQYDRRPKDEILLGDSQMKHLRPEDIAKVTGDPDYFNLAYGGGTLQESIVSFWHAESLTSLKTVYFEVSFADYNSNPLNRVDETEKLLHNPLQYFDNPDVLQASWYDLLAAVFHRQINLRPQMGRDAFWRYQLAYLAGRYHDINYPAALNMQLKQIAAFCRANHIHFYFVITPQSIDAQRRVDELGVTNEYVRFKSDLASIAPTIDCDIPSAITTNKDNYMDPFHMLDTAGAKVVNDIWMGKFQYCHQLGRW